MSNPRVFSPKEFGEAIGVSESSVKRWVDEGQIDATRTAGGHRRIPFAAAIRYVRSTKTPVLRPEILGLNEVSLAAARRDRDTMDELREHLEAGRADEGRGLIWGLFLDGHSVADIVDGPVREAMNVIGKKWQEGPEGIFVEHRATEICLRALTQLQLAIEVPEDAPLALGGAIEGDLSTLTSLACAVVLATEGYRVMNLGGNVPFDALDAAITAHDPRLVWVSVTHDASDAARPDFAPLSPSDPRDRLIRVAESLRVKGSHLAVGGYAVDTVEIPDHPAILRARRMGELAAFARGVRAA